MTKPIVVSVIAANGRSGSAFVSAALTAGMQVRAGVRGSHSFTGNDNLKVIKCDALEPKSVSQLLKGSDVVVSLIGHGKKSPSRLQTKATTNILKAMKEQKIKRLISLTGTGVRFHNDTPGVLDKLANRAITLIDRHRIEDGIAHAEILKSSQADWTLLRVLKLSKLWYNGDHVIFSLSGPAEYMTSRHKVASAIVQLIQEDSYIRQAPIIQ